MSTFSLGTLSDLNTISTLWYYDITIYSIYRAKLSTATQGLGLKSLLEHINIRDSSKTLCNCGSITHPQK